MESLIFHIDVNSAFLSWTALKILDQDPERTDPRTIPSIIGGDIQKRHGVVLAKSQSAKKYGIRTGEPIIHAMKKCPTLLILPPEHDFYEEMSFSLMDHLHGFSPCLEQTSIDECYLDMSTVLKSDEDPVQLACRIKDSVLDKLGFSVNVGISDRKVLAKMASDFQKPNRVHTLYSWEIKKKLWPLPVSDLYMCGKSSAQALQKLGIRTIGELAVFDTSILASHLKSHGILLHEYANGLDPSRVMTQSDSLKGIGNSSTYTYDLVEFDEIKKALLGLSESVSYRLRQQEQLARMISVEIRYHDFTQISHQKTLDHGISGTLELHKEVCALFLSCWNSEPVRLLGIRTSKLVSKDEPMQMNLFDLEKNTSNSEQKRKADSMMDDIKNRFGKDKITRGSLYRKH